MANQQQEVSRPTAECPEPQLWRCFDVMSAEVEVLEFMAQLMKTLKPKLVVETGTFRGLAAFYMGRALKENGRGKLITFEVEPELHAKAQTLIGKAGLSDVVDCRLQSSLEGKVEGTIDVLFTDSNEPLRVPEMRYYWPHLSTHSLIVCHDVNSDIHRKLRAEVLAQEFEQGQYGLSVVMLPTPRGLAFLQKREGRI